MHLQYLIEKYVRYTLWEINGHDEKLEVDTSQTVLQLSTITH